MTLDAFLTFNLSKQNAVELYYNKYGNLAIHIERIKFWLNTIRPPNQSFWRRYRAWSQLTSLVHQHCVQNSIMYLLHREFNSRHTLFLLRRNYVLITLPIQASKNTIKNGNIPLPGHGQIVLPHHRRHYFIIRCIYSSRPCCHSVSRHIISASCWVGRDFPFSILLHGILARTVKAFNNFFFYNPFFSQSWKSHQICSKARKHCSLWCPSIKTVPVKCLVQIV